MGEKATAQTADIVVYSLAWRGDRPAAAGEQPSALTGSRVVANGQELKFANGIEVSAAGDDFVEAKLRILVSSIQFQTLDNEAWDIEDLSGLHP